MSEQAKQSSSWTMLLDYGPLIVFFVAYKLAGSGLQGSLVATLAFMVAVIISIAVGLLVVKRVSPMVWISTALILGFGAITLYLRDPKFIQMKPTFIYLGFAAMLGGGLLRGKALLKWLFGPVFPGLTEEGWRKLSLNWALFFLALAVANEVMRATLTFDTWLTIKVWGVTVVSLVFAVANMPMLLRHGLDPSAKRNPLRRRPSNE
ncbi:septation protein IspZ [Sphingomonas daechungensis]|uniref:Inner membrane-spanning protein YciB n=1 Tax=Sphingomonas daechungensis TaxID=1176646 RepID=A0ABX6SYP2_9SPHN|nr:inner membrane-spanning protein YciB [Sphingomonas daechungensis]QNP42707.1 septation protein IspZ [Sphingomonas daechungensis]